MIKQKFLMWNPKNFDVKYDINTHMTGNINKVDKNEAISQWSRLKNILSVDNEVIDGSKIFYTSFAEAPDIVFTANAGLIYKNKVIITKFKNKERQCESKFYKLFFDKANYSIVNFPTVVYFEGAGDALFDKYGISYQVHYSERKKLLWIGYGFRTEEAAIPLIQYLFPEIKVQGLNLIDPSFYHLDTCFCPLEGGYLMYYPGAFDEDSLATINFYVPERFRIEVSREDALQFACNAVTYNRTIVMNNCSSDLLKKLNNLNFTVIRTPMSEFMKSGGSCRCLTLPLIDF